MNRKRIILIIFISILLVIITIPQVGQAITVSVYSLIIPKPKIQKMVENYIYDYNKTCEKDYRVKLTSMSEIGWSLIFELYFENEEISDNKKILEFFEDFHNEFGHPELVCASDDNNYYSKGNNTAEFRFGDLRITYGNNGMLPAYPPILQEQIDAFIYYPSTNPALIVLKEFEGVVLANGGIIQ